MSDIDPLSSSGSTNAYFKFVDENSGQTYQFGNTEFTATEWNMFLTNLLNQAMSDMRRNEKKSRETARKLKESIEGN